MRILFIVHQFMPEFAAGTERVTLNLARSAQRDGHQVEVLTCSVQESSRWDDDSAVVRHATVEGVPVYGYRGFELTPLEELGFTRSRASLIELEQFLDSRPPYDLVHVLHPMRMLDIIASVKERRIPYMITLTDFYLSCWRTNLIRADGTLCEGPSGGLACIRHCSTLEMNDRSLLERQSRMNTILEGAAMIVACSDYVARHFRSEFPQLSFRVVPHGIDLLRFRPRPRKEPRGEIVLGYVGTLSEMKGVHVVAEAFAKVAPPSAKLELVGPAHDPIFLQQLKAVAASHPGIVLTGAVAPDTVAEKLTKFDVLCLPSIVPETYSLATHEAMAAGIPCIVSSLGYPAEIVRENGCGEVADAGDVEAWADTLRRVLANPAIIEQWRKQLPSVQRVEEEGFFYSQLYRGLLTQDGSSVPTSIA